MVPVGAEQIKNGSESAHVTPHLLNSDDVKAPQDFTDCQKRVAIPFRTIVFTGLPLIGVASERSDIPRPNQ